MVGVIHGVKAPQRMVDARRKASCLPHCSTMSWFHMHWLFYCLGPITHHMHPSGHACHLPMPDSECPTLLVHLHTGTTYLPYA